MSKYRVYFNTGAAAAVTVEADDEDSAIDRAWDELPTDVCAQCGGWGRDYSLDLGEWDLDQNDDAVSLVDDE